MSRPEDPLGAISNLTSDTQSLPGQTSDQICAEEVERRWADDAEAVRNAQARIDNTFGVIGSFRDQEPAPKLPRQRT